MQSIVVVGLIVFLMGLVSTWGLVLYVEERHRLKAWRRRVLGKAEPLNLQAILTSLVDRTLRALECVGRAAKSGDEANVFHLPNLFVTAGYRHPHAPFLLAGAKVFGMLCLPIAALALHAAMFRASADLPLLIECVALTLVGWYGPDGWLRLKADRRREKILRAFPDALDLMVVCVEAGLGLDSAMSRVGSELRLAHTELSEEVQIMSLELRAGQARQRAIRNLGLRTDIDDVKSFCSMLIQTERFGTSLAQSLRLHSEAMRTHQQLQADEMATKLPVKLLFPLIFFIFPLLFIILLGPVAIRGMQSLLP